MLLAMLMVVANAKIYPTSKIYEWTGVEVGTENSKTTTPGWSMDGNFYVINDYQDAPLKFGVAMGVSPPSDYIWKSGSVIQSYIQFHSELTKFENLVCNLHIQTQDVNLLEVTNNKALSSYSCGQTLLHSIQTKNATYASITGEDNKCDNPWLSAPDFTGFIKQEATNKNYAVCSYFRYFPVAEKKVYQQLKLGQKIKFNVGFNVFTSLKSTGVQAEGFQDNLEWTLQENAHRFTAFVQITFLSSLLFIY